MIKAVLADLTVFNPAKRISLSSPFPEVFVPTLTGPTWVYKLVGRAEEDGDFSCPQHDDTLTATIPGVQAGEYVYWFDRQMRPRLID